MTVVQPAFALTLPQILTHDGWINHHGVASAASALALWAMEGGEVWLRSEHVAGKSHLLQALAHECDGAALLSIVDCAMDDSAALSAVWLDALAQGSCWLIDIRAGRLSENMQLALFHLIERGRRNGVPLVVGWRCDDGLITRAELLTRLRSMQPLVMQPPVDDDDLIAVLTSELDRMQWKLNSSVLRYILTHGHRDLASLLGQLRDLHQHSLRQQCKPSLVNIRHLLEGLPCSTR